MILTCCRMPILIFAREFRVFVVSSPPFAPPSLSVLHTLIFRHNPSSPYSRLYPLSSARILLKSSKCKLGNRCHGQRCHRNGLDTIVLSLASVIRLMHGT